MTSLKAKQEVQRTDESLGSSRMFEISLFKIYIRPEIEKVNSKLICQI